MLYRLFLSRFTVLRRKATESMMQTSKMKQPKLFNNCKMNYLWNQFSAEQLCWRQCHDWASMLVLIRSITVCQVLSFSDSVSCIKLIILLNKCLLSPNEARFVNFECRLLHQISFNWVFHDQLKGASGGNLARTLELHPYSLREVTWDF